jgi:hypothetical protein
MADDGWFATMLKKQSRWLALEGFKIHYSPEKTKTAVIVEPRPHPMLRPVVDNILHALGPEWNLHIFTSIKNKEWLTKTLDPHEYMVNTFNMENITREQYSSLLRTAGFWKLIHTESILIFQTDCIAFRPWDTAFEAYDYVGANYYQPLHTVPVLGGIQGGLSFRKKSFMLRCIEDCPIERIQHYRQEHGLEKIQMEDIAEDVYFTHACAILGAQCMDVGMRHYMAIEAEYFSMPFAFHGWNHPYFNEHQRIELLKRSPFFRKFLYTDE